MKLKPPNFNAPQEQINNIYKSNSKTAVLDEPKPKVEVPASAIKEVLDLTGVMSSSKDSDDVNSQFKKHLSARGGTLEDVAQNIVNIMSRGETEASRLRAAEFIAKIQGVQVELEEKVQVKEVTINILNQFSGSENRNLVQFVMPKG